MDVNILVGILSNLSENGAIKGSVAGVPMSTPAQKVWRVAQAIGDIAFAYPYTIVLLEIQVNITVIFTFQSVNLLIKAV